MVESENERFMAIILTFWINEKTVLGPVVMEPKEGTPPLSTGKIGVGLASYIARFDNLAITGGSNQR